MICKFEHDGDCCNSGATQYMCKCKQPCDTIMPVSNADRIRAMSDEELAGMLRSTGCPLVRSDMACKEFGSCRNCWLEYLKQPVKDGEDDGRT